MQALERRDVHGEPVEPETEAPQGHHERGADHVPAVKVSKAHALRTTLSEAALTVSPFSDVVVRRGAGIGLRASVVS